MLTAEEKQSRSKEPWNMLFYVGNFENGLDFAFICYIISSVKDAKFSRYKKELSM